MEKKGVIWCLGGCAFCSLFCVFSYLLLKKASTPPETLRKGMRELKEEWESFRLHVGTDWEQMAEKMENAIARLRQREKRRNDQDDGAVVAGSVPETGFADPASQVSARAAIMAREFGR